MLHGCIPIVCTPFDATGAVDHASLERQIDWLISEGASGVATLAIASEGFKLTDAERDDVAATVISATGRRVPVVVSADGGGLEVAVDRARRAARAGANAVMVLPPSFVKPDQENLFAYYAVIGQSVEIPVIIQDAPQLTGVAMGPALWQRLAEQVETIQYIKAEGMPQGVTISETIRLSGGKLQVFCGWGGIGLFDALERGAAGSMPAPNFTRLFSEVQRQWETGDRSGAEARFHRELPFVVWSIQSLDHSVGAAKEELVKRGLFRYATQRTPAIPLDSVAQTQLERFLAARLADGAA